MSAVLDITEATGRTWRTQIRPGKTWTIGRAKENDIVLNDRRASRWHAFIEMDGLDFKIIDGSTETGQLVPSVNHVFVNGAMRSEHKLQDGDVIVIGESSIEFRIIPEIKATRDLSPLRSPSQLNIEKPKTVSFDDSPLGHTQVALSVNELMGRRSDLSIETAIATPEEIKDLRRKAKILELLYEMSRTLGTVLEIDELFARVTDLIFRGTPADRVVALLADGKTGELEQVAARVREKDIEHLTQSLAVSRTITQKVMTERVAILSQDAKTDEQFQGAESIVSQGVRSTICAPLITQSGVHGVLYADRLDPFAAFRPDHLDLVSAVAAQAAITVETVRTHDRLTREEVARENFRRFVPEHVVDQLLLQTSAFRLGGVNQTVTVLFADIRGFTAFAENQPPDKVVGILNRYFSEMSEIIFSNQGTLDKYIGDGLMALFGAPTATTEDAANAVKAAVAMQRKAAELHVEFAREGFMDFAIGVGLHTGEATIGFIGSDKRSEYTAIGDTVNLASRLESQARPESLAGIGKILISDATATAAGNIFPLTARPPLTVKNRKQPVAVFDVQWN
ncbi:MAG TPA: adenylate/guanylate cyclase domain-containing protein [Pyrinomonadaceae bacterium]|nr:adenylate/guanylate cyclase domain-containing protein [Pyrinomonadaceae bacterium]